MATIATKNYKGMEFSEDFKMKSEDFEKLYGDCHIFNKLDSKTKSVELGIAFVIATSTNTPLKTVKK